MRSSNYSRGMETILGVQTIPSTGGTSRSEAGSSASASHQDVEAVATNAAAEADKADTPAKVKAAADQTVAAAATASPPLSTGTRNAAAQAHQQASAAKTPAEVAVAKEAVKKAAMQVASESKGGILGFLNRDVAGGIKVWQIGLGGLGLVGLITGIVLAATGGKK